MARYINVDDLEKCFEEFSYYYFHNYKDLAPVLHAKRVHAHTTDGRTHFVVCSYCGQAVDWADNYCRKCGACFEEV